MPQMLITPETKNCADNSWLSRYQIDADPEERDKWCVGPFSYSNKRRFKHPIYLRKIVEFMRLWQHMLQREGLFDLRMKVVQQFRRLDFATLLLAQGEAESAKVDFQRLESILDAELDVRAPHYSPEERADYILFVISHPEGLLEPSNMEWDIQEYERIVEFDALQRKEKQSWPKRRGPESFLSGPNACTKAQLRYWAETWREIADAFNLWEMHKWLADQLHALPHDMVREGRDEAYDYCVARNKFDQRVRREYEKRVPNAGSRGSFDFLVFAGSFDETRFQEFLTLDDRG